MDYMASTPAEPVVQRVFFVWDVSYAIVAWQIILPRCSDYVWSWPGAWQRLCFVLIMGINSRIKIRCWSCILYGNRKISTTESKCALDARFQIHFNNKFKFKFKIFLLIQRSVPGDVFMTVWPKRDSLAELCTRWTRISLIQTPLVLSHTKALVVNPLVHWAVNCEHVLPDWENWWTIAEYCCHNLSSQSLFCFKTSVWK